MQSKKAGFFAKQNIFLLFFSLIFFSLYSLIGHAGLDIDASWHEALVMVIEKKLVFGKDFIFTYGPLGFLNTGILPKNISIFFPFAVSLFILFNYLIIIKLAFQKAEKNFNIVAISAAVILIPWGFISDTSFTLFFFLLFWLLHAKSTRNSLSLLIVIILSILIFYIKVNLSIIAYSIFYSSLIYFSFIKIFTLRTVLLCAIFQILITFSLSFLLNVDIGSYIGASFKIIDAYQDAISVMLLGTKDFLVLLVFEILILLAILILIWKITFNAVKPFQSIVNNLYLYTLIGIAWFLCFKQAHTAVGAYNVFGFFLFLPPLATLLYLFTPEINKILAGKIFIIILCLQLVATQIIRYQMGGHTIKGYLLTCPPHLVTQNINQNGISIKSAFEIIEQKNPFNYINQLVNYNYEDYFKNPPVIVSNDLIKKIGRSSIDIVPHQISSIFFSRLNYNPRPIIQSYAAYNSWLMKKNGDKYLSKTAPDFVLFRLDSFREQNPFWVETDLSEALLRNYKLTDTTLINKDTFFVFQKNKILKQLIVSSLQKNNFKLNQEISIPKSENPIRFSANINYSSKGKLARLVFQPPYLYCTVTYENGNQENFRVIDKILKGGIFINQKITTQAEASNFFVNKGVDNQRVIKIRFWTKYESGFEQDFEGEFKEVKITE